MCSGEVQEGRKIKGFSVISGCDAAAMLESAKGAFHDIAFFIDAARVTPFCNAV